MSNKYKNELNKYGTLDVRENDLLSLDKLPDGIIGFNCNSNRLDVLPELPKGLKKIYCDYNDLEYLPKLPDGLFELSCATNKIKYLPELPNSLAMLFCDDNRLESLPVLPEGLTFLNCTYNKLKSLPELPVSLEYLYCNNNPLECVVPTKFLNQNKVWFRNYYYPYIRSYKGQKNILSKFPSQCAELMKQVDINRKIRKEFSYLFDSCELNLL